MSDVVKTEKPTAIALFKKEVDRFLNSADPEVLCIRGEWGVGKTYAWDKYFEEAKQQARVKLKEYSYVSLFGIQSLDQLKFAIFENVTSTKSRGSVPTFASFMNRMDEYADKALRVGTSSALNSASGRGVAGTAKAALFMTVKEQIICLDDIERKGDSLRMKDVLGLVSMLRLKRECKVIIILNSTKLDDKDDLDTLEEKVVDSTLVFAPTEEECVSIVLHDQTGWRGQVATYSKLLGITNIRIIHRIVRLVERLVPLLCKFDPLVLKQAIQSTVLFGHAYYGNIRTGEEKLLDFAVKKRGKGIYGTTPEKGLTEAEKAWDSLLDLYGGFTDADSFDLTLLQGIERGFFDEDVLIQQAQDMHDRIAASKVGETIQTAWRKSFDSFDLDQEEVIAGILASSKASISLITPDRLHATLLILREMGLQSEASTLLADYMQSSNATREFYDLDTHSIGREAFTDKEMIDAFAHKYDSFIDKRDPKDVLMTIGKEKVWSPTDLQLISTLDYVDIYIILKSLEGTDLRKARRALNSLGRVSGSEGTKIGEDVSAAYDLIESESLLNARRVRQARADTL